jgi:arginyl-tRNA--protein-N-Asp/Glu arginylyltransferase
MHPRPIPPQNHHALHTVKAQTKARVADQNYDPVEHTTLETARIFFVAFTQPETQFWMHAYRYCERIYSTANGAVIAQATLGMLNAMRHTRPHTFNYTDPRCRHCSECLTAEERYLMESFRKIRLGKRTSARMSALLLCEGKDPSAFLDAASHLAAVLEAAR